MDTFLNIAVALLLIVGLVLLVKHSKSVKDD